MDDHAGFDEHGQWTGTCSKCGTNHDGYPPGTFGGEIRCLRSQAEHLGAPHLVDQIDALRDHAGRRRDEALAAEDLIPPEPAFDPGPCPHCGQRDYEVDWISVGAPPWPDSEKIPGTVRCLNPECPGRAFSPQLGSGWANADRSGDDRRCVDDNHVWSVDVPRDDRTVPCQCGGLHMAHIAGRFEFRLSVGDDQKESE